MSKFTIDLGRETEELLSQVAREKQISKADVIRRAIATYVVVNREAKEGNCITINGPSGVSKELLHV